MFNDLFSVHIGHYRLLCHPSAPPSLWDVYLERAKLVEKIDDSTDNQYSHSCYLVVYRGDNNKPLLVLALSFQPSGSTYPSVLIVPETDILFLGAGETLLAYELTAPAKFSKSRISVNHEFS